ncbi:unnamed protein product [Periconia digitata]|uniref:Uncharacterized protein n=1 Tax=Periconia digitata TaxID=1303443 RepID=A0A9W4U7N0_9PLEO|nr:unnamed protein product [Periconia digitata]
MLRKLLLRPSASTRFCARSPPRRHFDTKPSPASSTASSQSRIQRFNRRMPKFLHKYTNALASAPVSHITSFLILHELTAIVPLFGLAATFHYTHWLPPWFAEGELILQGVDRFGKWFRKKGWIRSEEANEAELEVEMRKRDKAWGISEGGVRLVVEFATAYAVTKALLPLRIVASVWATPWFAQRAIVPVLQRFKGVFTRRKQKSTESTGAGTGSTGAGAIPKSHKKDPGA